MAAGGGVINTNTTPITTATTVGMAMAIIMIIIGNDIAIIVYFFLFLLLVLRVRVTFRFLLLRKPPFVRFFSSSFIPRTFSGLFPEPRSPSRVEMNSGCACAL
jgi:hypothetical protein